ncbi:MAG: hypothetical protein JWN98_1455 [Abditibacteriota bacterium]|jgi:predicted dehydrogenase|nr:hypothetical protein [Abditibacteriota bacterium]
MTLPINVGLIGIGGMGRMHFNCYKNNPGARIVALADVDQRKREGDWGSIGLNIDTSKTERVDLSGIQTYENWQEMLADDSIRLVDICLPTPLHAQVTIAALQAGKDVLCEKPMAMNAQECQQMAQAAREAGRQLLIGHCLRYWPAYVQTQKLIASGEFGRPLYASFHRSSGTPLWSYNNWLATGSQSGGVVLDMHIHDVDAALWWFGAPDEIHADGLIQNDLPMSVDATWRYNNGPLVSLHGGWDNNGSPFRFAFKVVMEHASILCDSSTNTFCLLQDGESRDIPVADELAYQNEINDFIACLSEDRPLQRVTPESSQLAVTTVSEELRQIEAKQR